MQGAAVHGGCVVKSHGPSIRPLFPYRQWDSGIPLPKLPLTGTEGQVEEHQGCVYFFPWLLGPSLCANCTPGDEHCFSSPWAQLPFVLQSPAAHSTW